MRIAVAQFGPTKDHTANALTIAQLTADAARDGAQLVVFPEEAMMLTDGHDLPLHEVVAEVWPQFIGLLARLAVEHGIAVIAGGYEPNGTSRPHNTLVCVDHAGAVIAEYRKLHLYDAFAYQESGYVTAGAELPPVVEIDGVRVGLINCYDIRFPELARHLVDSGADVLSVSAAWVDGPHKEDHWTTLLRARAIENTVWLAAAGTITDECIGRSSLIDPLGLVVADLGKDAAAVAVADIDTARTSAVRQTLPALANRRIRLTYEVTEAS
ncbi:carbon-nitrogen hydrolase family protein [Microbacterium fluvii]|uniref:Carbon-nitrogen hydrolase family protein n=1 Tax=Microbacterium fluvii TaxID=415215 RepID=A0ABW2HI92_9MICO|nr:carbon-nitrogen hydrolase family protein [Microbacterium fluvii]MCU4673952.1 carbon-nitrogen hydrolase family protein [Microbacterium fluvii]